MLSAGGSSPRGKTLKVLVNPFRGLKRERRQGVRGKVGGVWDRPKELRWPGEFGPKGGVSMREDQGVASARTYLEKISGQSKSGKNQRPIIDEQALFWHASLVQAT